MVIDVNGDWLHQALQQNLKIDRWQGVKNLKIDNALGYTSDIQRVEPIWDGKNLPKTLIIKALDFKEIDALVDFRSDNAANEAFMRYFHRTECRYYNILTRTLPPPIAIPRIYYCSTGDEPGEFPVIVMEDLGAYKVVDMIDGINEEQLYALVEELAKLHFYSLTYDGWKKLKPIPLPETAESYNDLTHFFLKKLKKQTPGCFEKADDVMKLFKNTDFLTNYQMKCSKEKNSVIVHGDLWTANLLWDDNKLKGIIDWQQSHCGSITEDILRVLVTGTSIKLKKKITKKLLHHYFEELQKAFADIGQNAPFTFQDVEENYRSMLPITTATTIFSVGMWSNSEFMKVDSTKEERRIKEMHHRLEDLINETYDAIYADNGAHNFYGVENAG